MGPINDDVASLVIAQLLFLQSESSKKPIHMYINSPGSFELLKNQDSLKILFAQCFRWNCYLWTRNLRYNASEWLSNNHYDHLFLWNLVYYTSDCNLVCWTSMFNGLFHCWKKKTHDEQWLEAFHDFSSRCLDKASLLLTAGTAGLRHSLPNSFVHWVKVLLLRSWLLSRFRRIMVHQPSGGVQVRSISNFKWTTEIICLFSFVIRVKRLTF